MDLKDRLGNLLWRLQDLIENAPAEEDCTDEENDMYADMENLIESIENYLREE